MSSGLKKVFDILTVCLFPLLMFVIYLITTINGYRIFGPTGWVIIVISMVSSLALALFAFVAQFAQSDEINKINRLFAIIFVLALLLNVLFTQAGDSIVLGNLDIIVVVIYALYVDIMFASLSPLGKSESKSENDYSEYEESKPEDLEPEEE